jgi:predicted transcriptional regulator
MGTQLRGDARDELRESVRGRYQDGKSVRDIAREEDRSYGLIHRLLIESGVVFRPRGGARNQKTS